MSGSPPGFIADAMLGRLARWLRLAGCDTIYDASLDDGELARLARESGRILLTRDRELAGRRGLRAYLVQSEEVQAQMAEVLGILCPGDWRRAPRCAACNGVLIDVERETVRGRVPTHVWLEQTAFRVCQACGRVYWAGSHWEDIRRRLDEACGPVH